MTGYRNLDLFIGLILSWSSPKPLFCAGFGCRPFREDVKETDLRKVATI